MSLHNNNNNEQLPDDSSSMGNIASRKVALERAHTPARQIQNDNLIIFSSPNFDYEQPDYQGEEIDYAALFSLDNPLDTETMNEGSHLDIDVDNAGVEQEKAKKPADDDADSCAVEDGEYESDSNDSVEFILDKANPKMAASTTLSPYIAIRRDPYNARISGRGRGRARGRGGNTFHGPGLGRMDPASSGMGIQSNDHRRRPAEGVSRELFQNKIPGSSKTAYADHGSFEQSSINYQRFGPSIAKRRISTDEGDESLSKVPRTEPRSQPRAVERAPPNWEEDDFAVDPNDVVSSDDEDHFPERPHNYSVANIAARINTMLAGTESPAVARAREKYPWLRSLDRSLPSSAAISGSSAGHGTLSAPPAKDPNFDLHMPSVHESVTAIDAGRLSLLPRISRKLPPTAATPARVVSQVSLSAQISETGTPMPEMPRQTFRVEPDPWATAALSHGKNKKKKRKTGDRDMYTAIDNSVIDALPKKSNSVPGSTPADGTAVPTARGKGRGRGRKAATGTSSRENNSASPVSVGGGRLRTPAGPRMSMLPMTNAQKRAQQKRDAEMSAERKAADRRRQEVHESRAKSRSGQARQ